LVASSATSNHTMIREAEPRFHLFDKPSKGSSAHRVKTSPMLSPRFFASAKRPTRVAENMNPNTGLSLPRFEPPTSPIAPPAMESSS
jgi:hypothetical protein